MHRRTPLRMGPLRFRDPVLLCGVLYGLLLFDASGFLRAGLLAAFLHEWGHILVYWAQQRRFPVIESVKRISILPVGPSNSVCHVS